MLNADYNINLSKNKNLFFIINTNRKNPQFVEWFTAGFKNSFPFSLSILGQKFSNSFSASIVSTKYLDYHEEYLTLSFNSNYFKGFQLSKNSAISFGYSGFSFLKSAFINNHKNVLLQNGSLKIGFLFSHKFKTVIFSLFVNTGPVINNKLWEQDTLSFTTPNISLNLSHKQFNLNFSMSDGLLGQTFKSSFSYSLPDSKISIFAQKNDIEKQVGLSFSFTSSFFNSLISYSIPSKFANIKRYSSYVSDSQLNQIGEDTFNQTLANLSNEEKVHSLSAVASLLYTIYLEQIYLFHPSSEEYSQINKDPDQTFDVLKQLLDIHFVSTIQFVYRKDGQLVYDTKTFIAENQEQVQQQIDQYINQELSNVENLSYEILSQGDQYYLNFSKLSRSQLIVCRHITGWLTKELSKNGFKAHSLGFFDSLQGGHTFSLAFDRKTAYVIDGGQVFKTDLKNFDNLLRTYFKQKQELIPVKLSVFDKDGKRVDDYFLPSNQELKEIYNFDKNTLFKNLKNNNSRLLDLKK